MRKSWRGGDELLWKNDTLVVTLTNHVILGPVYIAPGPWYFRDFSNIFLPNKGEDQEKVLQSASGAMTLCPVVNLALVSALRS